jgi:hypothetical protein
MVQIEDFCVDRYEAAIRDHSPFEVPSGGVAVSEAGLLPQGYISGALAELACEGAVKRLCTSEEWLRACGGPDGTTWPYGDSYEPNACNDSRSSHPIVDFFGDDPNRWQYEAMNDPGINQQPDTLDPSGANPGCVSAEGVYDMHGNLHEWVADTDGVFRGGFYADGSINGPGCSYRTGAHSFDYHDYSTGFRCCTELRIEDRDRNRGSRIEDRGSRIEDRGSGIEDRGSRIEDRKTRSRIEDRGSRIEDQGLRPEIEDRGSSSMMVRR